MRKCSRDGVECCHLTECHHHRINHDRHNNVRKPSTNWTTGAESRSGSNKKTWTVSFQADGEPLDGRTSSDSPTQRYHGKVTLFQSTIDVTVGRALWSN
jgi:hypothetical protein